ncbi:hypothetical protein Droror1_Dr00007053 [Drosera rotundifolia]
MSRPWRRDRDGRLGRCSSGGAVDWRGRERKKEEREVGGRKEGRRGEREFVKLCKCGEAVQRAQWTNVVDKYGKLCRASAVIQIQILIQFKFQFNGKTVQQSMVENVPIDQRTKLSKKMCKRHLCGSHLHAM